MIHSGDAQLRHTGLVPSFGGGSQESPEDIQHPSCAPVSQPPFVKNKSREKRKEKKREKRREAGREGGRGRKNRKSKGGFELGAEYVKGRSWI